MKDFKPMRELISVLLDIAKTIKGESEGGSNEKPLDYFELTNKPIGVIFNSFASPQSYDEGELIKIEDFVEEVLGVPKRKIVKYFFVYDKDVSNTVNFDIIKPPHSATIANGSKSCIELAPNRFCFNDAE